MDHVANKKPSLFEPPPRYLRSRQPARTNRALARTLLRLQPARFEHIVNGVGFGDVDDTFLGMVDTYKALAPLISLDRTVIDFGCAYAPQAYYFRKHAKYIGVDPTPAENRFAFANTEHFVGTIQTWLALFGTKPWLQTAFAICNYVPDAAAQRAVREACQNVFVYYPA